MGNAYSLLDAVSKVAEGAIASGLKAKIGEIPELALFDVSKTERTVFLNSGRILSTDVLRIKNGRKAYFILNADKVDNEHFKETVKREIAAAVYAIQYSTDFDDFLKEVKVANSTALVNLLCLSVEDFFDVKMITRNVAYAVARDEESVYSIDFSYGLISPSGLSYYSRDSLQSYYIANVVRCFLDSFVEDSRVSPIAGNIKRELEKVNNEEQFTTVVAAGASVFAISVAVISIIYILHNRKYDLKQIKIV